MDRGEGRRGGLPIVSDRLLRTVLARTADVIVSTVVKATLQLWSGSRKAFTNVQKLSPPMGEFPAPSRIHQRQLDKGWVGTSPMEGPHMQYFYC